MEQLVQFLVQDILLAVEEDNVELVDLGVVEITIQILYIMA